MTRLGLMLKNLGGGGTGEANKKINCGLRNLFIKFEMS